MTREEIATFDKVAVQLDSFYTETTVLVKKDPKAEMNVFKLKLINKKIVLCYLTLILYVFESGRPRGCQRISPTWYQVFRLFLHCHSAGDTGREEYPYQFLPLCPQR